MELLISIVDPEEAVAAIEGGTDILDIKNPKEGALGANFPHVIRSVKSKTPPVIPVSVAIGDAPFKPGATALAALGAATCCVDFIKVGLFGTKTMEQAIELIASVCRAVRDHAPATQIIAAAYADANDFGALPPLELPAVASAAGANGCIIDTAGKNGEGLFSHLDDLQLGIFIDQCQKLNLRSALAGSLKKTDIPRIKALHPDIVGFRGAACGGDRLMGRVSVERVRELKSAMK